MVKKGVGLQKVYVFKGNTPKLCISNKCRQRYLIVICGKDGVVVGGGGGKWKTCILLHFSIIAAKGKRKQPRQHRQK